MVKLEAENGASIYVNPHLVSSIVSSAVSGLTVVVVAHREHIVKGTPDAVHERLCLPPPLSDMAAARIVLEWAAGAEETWYDELGDHARKALGR